MAVTAAGSRVGDARLSASDLAEIIRRTQQALQRVGQVLHGEQSRGRGRKRKEIEELCELFFVGWRDGSAIADLELGEPPAQLHLFGYIGEESLQAFANGMAKIAAGGVESGNLPGGFDMGVLQSCDALTKVLDHGIASITYEARNGQTFAPVRFDNSVRDKIRALLDQPGDVSHSVKTGRLEELNGHGVLTGRLWEANNTKWLCHFRNEHLDQLPDAWMRTVRVTGRAIMQEAKEYILEVESLVILDSDLPEHAIASETAPFWESLSLDELAQRQGVGPVTDLDEISALWPVDDDPDELVEHVLSERAARRTSGKNSR
jgi:hypothetical protein